MGTCLIERAVAGSHGREIPTGTVNVEDQAPARRGFQLSLLARVVAVFAACIAVACAVAALIYGAVDSSVGAMSGVRAQNQVIAANDRLSRTVTDAETTEHAFLLTGNDAFLTAYEGALRSFDEAAVELRKLITAPPQLGRLATMQSLFARWRSGVAASEVAARRNAPVGLSEAAQGAYTTTLAMRRLAEDSAGTPSVRAAQWTVLAGVLRQHLNAMVALDQSSAGLKALQNAYSLLGDAEMVRADTPPSRMIAVATALDSVLSERLQRAQADEARVQQLVALDAGRTQIDQVRQIDAAFLAAANADLAAQLAANQRFVLQAKLAATATPILLVLLLAVVLRVWSGIRKSIMDVVAASAALASGDYSRRVQVRGRDYVARMARAYNAMADRMGTQAHEAQALVRLSDLFQASVSIEEACEIIRRGIPDLFPGVTGAVYLASPSRDVLEPIASWGDAQASPRGFAPEDCWAVRRGQAHAFRGGPGDVACRHLTTPPPAASLCVPLVAQGDAIGVLCLFESDGPSRLTEQAARLARVVGDQIGLAIANLRLRETLREQSIRDPLTGLYNRRYLEETLDREIARAARNRQPFSIVMFDIDLFKQFNDAFGHGAGDHLLREIGALLRARSRTEDVACRYGGDEFVIALLGAPLAEARRRAEEIGMAARHPDVRYQGRSVGAVTLSLGVAAHPTHGTTTEALIRASDAALYRAKEQGRARVEVAAG